MASARPKFLHMDALARLLARAIAAGAKHVSATRVRWVISGNCTEPYVRDVTGVNAFQASDGTKYRTFASTVELHTRCRRCENCRNARRNMWTERARIEITRAMARGCRTWHFDLTLRPDVAAQMKLQAAARVGRQGVDYEALPDAERFNLWWGEMAKEITLMIKRLRKKGHLFRYLVVAEKHDGTGQHGRDGVPHAHLFIHETDPSHPVPKAALQGEWPHGFTGCKLVTSRQQTGYVTKYVAGQARTRVRNSERYGQEENALRPSVGKARL